MLARTGSCCGMIMLSELPRPEMADAQGNLKLVGPASTKCYGKLQTKLALLSFASVMLLG